MPRLDYFDEETSIQVDKSVVSFDAYGINDTAILIAVDGRDEVNSTVYKYDQQLRKFIPFGQVMSTAFPQKVYFLANQ